MKALTRIVLCIAMAGCLLGIGGCGKQADENKPIEEVQAEAAKMDVAQLKAKAMEYKDAIVAKKAELEKLTAKLKEIPLAQQLGAEAKAIQADIANVNKAIAPLTERFQVYYNKLKEKGGNLAGLEL